MEDIAAWLGKQLDEDERFARAASGTLGMARPWYEAQGLRKAMPGMQRADCIFIARHDPARVLREVAAKRALLAHFKQQYDDAGAVLDMPYGGPWDEPFLEFVEETKQRRSEAVRMMYVMAAPYVDRDGYNPAWRVE